MTVDEKMLHSISDSFLLSKGRLIALVSANLTPLLFCFDIWEQTTQQRSLVLRVQFLDLIFGVSTGAKPDCSSKHATDHYPKSN